MPKKNITQKRKRSCEEPVPRVRYQEKAPAWQCGVCHETYDRSQEYCLSCMQSLYYYCYINNELFVTRDDSYLQLYYPMPAEQLSSCSQTSEQSVEEEEQGINLDWVQSLLA